MRWKVYASAAALAMAMAMASTAAGTTGKRADFALGFSTKARAARAALTLHVVYKAPGDPNGKPSPIRKVVVTAPAGTRFHTGAVARCTATDDELEAEGRGACPEASRIGAGKLTADTGFGAPVDPLAGDLTLFNSGTAVVEVVTAPGTDRVLGIDRLKIAGSTLSGHPPTTPGGPPDGETAVRQIDFTIDRKTGYVTTPRTCPRSRRWTATGTFGFKDGSEETLTSRLACKRPPRRRSSPSPSLRSRRSP
jgi:hypothetical protein